MGCVSAKERTAPLPRSDQGPSEGGHNYGAIKAAAASSSAPASRRASVVAASPGSVARGPQPAPANTGSRRGSDAGSPRIAADTEEWNPVAIEEDEGEDDDYVPPKRKVSKLVRRGQAEPSAPAGGGSPSEGECDEALVLVCADCGAEILKSGVAVMCPVSGKNHV